MDIFAIGIRTSAFYNGQENQFSIRTGDGEGDLFGHTFTVTNYDDATSLWTFDLDGSGEANMRLSRITNTFDGGVMLELNRAKCTLSGTSQVLLRSPSDAPDNAWVEEFWKNAEAGLQAQGDVTTRSLEHKPD